MQRCATISETYQILLWWLIITKKRNSFLLQTPHCRLCFYELQGIQPIVFWGLKKWNYPVFNREKSKQQSLIMCNRFFSWPQLRRLFSPLISPQWGIFSVYLLFITVNQNAWIDLDRDINHLPSIPKCRTLFIIVGWLSFVKSTDSLTQDEDAGAHTQLRRYCT